MRPIHGMSVSNFYKKWHGLKYRCENKNYEKFQNYGGRGIKVGWKSFEEFRDDMYESYVEHLNKFGQKQTTLDRIDNNKNYCKENCRWATYQEQEDNRRNKYSQVTGLKKIATLNGKSYRSFHYHISIGRTVEEALQKSRPLFIGA